MFRNSLRNDNVRATLLITPLYFALITAATLIALYNWRAGFLLMLVAGGLQDPVRKMMPGTPGWMVLSFIPIWLAVCISLFKTVGWPWEPLFQANARLRAPINLVLWALLLALFVLFAKYGVGVWPVGMIGLIGYAIPLLAIAVGFLYVRERRDLLRFMRFYCLLTSVLLVGGLLEHWNVYPEWGAVGTEALGTQWFRHVPGYIVYLKSGFYRSPDLLGWHAALLVMFSLLLALRARNPLARVTWMGLLAWGAFILLISGRNKMILMPVVFLVVVALAYAYKGNVGRTLWVVSAGAVALALLLIMTQQLKLDEEYLLYTQVGTEAAGERLKSHGIKSVWTTFQQSGFFGEGLGSASTGARYGGGNMKTWQESGPSKLMVELGVLGLLASLLLAVAMMHTLLRLLRNVPHNAPELLIFIGFLGLLAANGASFTISHQAFGDPFLVSLAGFFVGVAFSAPRWVGTGKTQERSRA